MNFSKYLVFCILFSASLFAQKPLVYDDSLKVESLVPYLQKMEGVVVDTITYNNITRQTFKYIESAKLGKSHGEYWFRFAVKNEYPTEQSMIIFMKGMSMFKFDIYQQTDSLGLVKIKSLEEGLSLKNRLIPHRYEEFLNLAPNQITSFYINVFFPKSVVIALNATKVEVKAKLDQRNYLKQGLYYGIAMMMLVLNLFLFRSFRDLSYIYYAGLLVSLVLIIAVLDGVLYSILSEVLYLFVFDFMLHFVAIIFLSTFSIHFLDLKTYLPNYIKLIYAMLGVMAFFYGIYYLTDSSIWFIYGEFTGVFILLLCCIAGFLMLKKSKFAIFFVSSYSLMILVFLLFAISVYIPSLGIKANLDYLKIGSILEMCILTYGVSSRIKELDNQKFAVELDLQKVGQELKFFKEGYTKGKVTVNELKLVNFSNYYGLTKQEVRVVLLLLKGNTNNEIAEKLFISQSTVKFHVKNIYAKSGVHKRGDLLVGYANF